MELYARHWNGNWGVVLTFGFSCNSVPKVIPGQQRVDLPHPLQCLQLKGHHPMDPALRFSARDSLAPVLNSLSCVQLFVSPCTVAYKAPHPEFSGTRTLGGLPSLLQKIFPTQGLNASLLHCKQVLYCVSYMEVPIGTSSVSKDSFVFTTQGAVPSATGL